MGKFRSGEVKIHGKAVDLHRAQGDQGRHGLCDRDRKSLGLVLIDTIRLQHPTGEPARHRQSRRRRQPARGEIGNDFRKRMNIRSSSIERKP